MKSSIAHERSVPFLVRLIGGRWVDQHDGVYRMRWGELSFRRFGLAVALCLFEEHYSLHIHMLWLNAYVTLPFLRRWHREPHEIMESWGVSYNQDDGTVHCTWGKRYKIFTLPWRNWIQTRHDVLRPDGSWIPFVGCWEDKEPDGRLVETHPYRYLLKSGEVQHRTAECSAERLVRRLRLLRWTSLFQRTTHAIDVKFSDEVGEESGSWKGGCVGCGYIMRPGETIRECLKRMEVERRF